MRLASLSTGRGARHHRRPRNVRRHRENFRRRKSAAQSTSGLRKLKASRSYVSGGTLSRKSHSSGRNTKGSMVHSSGWSTTDLPSFDWNTRGSHHSSAAPSSSVSKRRRPGPCYSWDSYSDSRHSWGMRSNPGLHEFRRNYASLRMAMRRSMQVPDDSCIPREDGAPSDRWQPERKTPACGHCSASWCAQAP